MNTPKSTGEAWDKLEEQVDGSVEALQHFDKYRDEGFSLDHVDSYVVGNNVLYAAIWTKPSGAFTAYHGRNAEEHQGSFDSLKSEGWRPKVISVASVGGKLRYTALNPQVHLVLFLSPKRAFEIPIPGARYSRSSLCSGLASIRGQAKTQTIGETL